MIFYYDITHRVAETIMFCVIAHKHEIFKIKN